MLPESSLVILPDCGALAALEAPQSIADTLADQLRPDLHVVRAG
jgi:hypothetical protein